MLTKQEFKGWLDLQQVQSWLWKNGVRGRHNKKLSLQTLYNRMSMGSGPKGIKYRGEWLFREYEIRSWSIAAYGLEISEHPLRGV